MASSDSSRLKLVQLEAQDCKGRGFDSHHAVISILRVYVQRRLHRHSKAQVLGYYKRHTQITGRESMAVQIFLTLPPTLPHRG